MKRNLFGAMRPATEAEIREALDEMMESGFDRSGLEAEITYSDWDPVAPENGINMTGYTAEIRDPETGDELFTTQGFQNREGLVSILHRVGIENVVDVE